MSPQLWRKLTFGWAGQIDKDGNQGSEQLQGPRVFLAWWLEQKWTAGPRSLADLVVGVTLMCLLRRHAWHSEHHSCIRATIPQSPPLNRAVTLMGLPLKAAACLLLQTRTAAGPCQSESYLLCGSVSVQGLLTLVWNKLQNGRYSCHMGDWRRASVMLQ